MTTPRTDHEGHPIHERRSDDSPWGQLAVAIERYKILWFAGIAVSGWLGVRLIEPLKAVAVISVRQTQMDERLLRMDGERVDMKNVLAILVRVQCLQLGSLDRAKVGLDCQSIPYVLPPLP